MKSVKLLESKMTYKVNDVVYVRFGHIHKKYFVKKVLNDDKYLLQGEFDKNVIIEGHEIVSQEKYEEYLHHNRLLSEALRKLTKLY